MTHVIELDRPMSLMDLGTEQRDEINAALRRGLRPLEAPTPMRLSQWMSALRRLHHAG